MLAHVSQSGASPVLDETSLLQARPLQVRFMWTIATSSSTRDTQRSRAVEPTSQRKPRRCRTAREQLEQVARRGWSAPLTEPRRVRGQRVQPGFHGALRAGSPRCVRPASPAAASDWPVPVANEGVLVNVDHARREAVDPLPSGVFHGDKMPATPNVRPSAAENLVGICLPVRPSGSSTALHGAMQCRGLARTSFKRPRLTTPRWARCTSASRASAP